MLVIIVMLFLPVVVCHHYFYGCLLVVLATDLKWLTRGLLICGLFVDSTYMSARPRYVPTYLRMLKLRSCFEYYSVWTRYCTLLLVRGLWFVCQYAHIVVRLSFSKLAPKRCLCSVQLCGASSVIRLPTVCYQYLLLLDHVLLSKFSDSVIAMYVRIWLWELGCNG